MTYAARGATPKKQWASCSIWTRINRRTTLPSANSSVNWPKPATRGHRTEHREFLWAQKGHPFLPAFLEIAKGSYQANLNQADFVTEAEAVRSEINRWWPKRPRKIQDILPPGSLAALTRLVLANAIYFKGIWGKPYDKSATSPQPFRVSTARQTNVPLMHHFDEVQYMENGEFQAVELPYKDGELSMVILLPRQVDGCGDLETG
jgi:serpin B